MRYLKLYYHTMKIQLQSLMEYKTDFIIGMITEIGRNLIGIAMIWIIFTNVTSINGWTMFELLLISGFGILIWGLFLLFFNLWEMERLIVTGEFDRFLTRPLNPLFQLITSRVNPEHVGDIVTGTVLIIMSSIMIGIEWNPLNIGLLLIFIISGVLILFSVLLIPATIAFWTTRSHALMSVISRFSNLAEYPLEIYNIAAVFFISFILPFAFTSYYPATVFLDKGIYVQFVYFSPLIAGVLFGIAYSFWKFGLKHYTSTGS